MFPGEYRIYGLPRSFFTAKVENILRFLDVPYTYVPKGPHEGSDIEKRGGSGAVPLLQTPEDWVLADSTPIARMLSDRYPDKHFIPRTPVQRIAALLLEDWIDEWFTRVAMHTRWNYPESVDAVFGGELASVKFGKSWFELSEEERDELRPLMAEMEPRRQQMATAGAELLAASLDNGQDIMPWFGTFLDTLAAHLEHHPFFFGSRPSIADFAVSGGFSAHFAYDPVPRRFVEERQPVALDYADRCWHAHGGTGDWVSDDQVPETLFPLFEQFLSQYGQYLIGNREALDAGKNRVEMDLGFGPRTIVAAPYREVCRLDVRGEILRLDDAAQKRLHAVLPKELLDIYLMPPLKPPTEVPRVKGLAQFKQ